jgi:hypothetical protein
MKKIYFLSLMLFSLTYFGQVNIITTAPATNSANATTGLRAPNGNSSHTSLRACYHVPASELTALTGSISSFGFVLTNTLVSAPANGTLTVYLLNTTSPSYTLGTSWSTATVGMTQVFNGVYNLPTGNTATVVDFPFPSNFSYTPGNSLFVAYEYKGGQFAPNNAVYSAYSNSAVTAGATNVSALLPAVNTLSTTTFRPLFRFGIPNTYTNEISVMILNAQGKVSQTTGTNHTITANIFNGSNTTLNNINVDLTVIGTNAFTAAVSVPSLAAGVSTLVVFPAYNPTVLGISNIAVSVANDQNNSNNSVNLTQSVTCNFIGTAPASVAPTSYSSGVGFNTGSGVIYSRFINAATQTITGADIAISSGVSNAGRSVYAVVANNTGSVLATSNTLVISGSELNTFQTFTFAPKIINGNTPFYVGLAQTAGSPGYFPLGATPAPGSPTLYVTQALAGGSLTPLTGNLGFFGIEPFFMSPCGGVGIIESNDQPIALSVYPNPAKEQIVVEVSNVNANTQIEIYNVLGAKVITVMNVSERNVIAISNLENGVYLLSINNGKNKAVKKLIKE